jgi:hypothetical protein
MTRRAVSCGCLLGMFYSTHHLDCLSEAKERASGEDGSVYAGGVPSKSERLGWTGLRIRGWNGVEVGVSIQLMRSGRGLEELQGNL